MAVNTVNLLEGEFTKLTKKDIYFINEIGIQRIILNSKSEVTRAKGILNIFCRVRPLLDKHEKDGVQFTYDGSTLIFQNKSFQFHSLFPPTTVQAELFENLKLYVDAALNGGNICVFAYGQTGSGKTYTIEGKNTPDHMGFFPRALKMAFQFKEQRETPTNIISFKISAIEIYNDNFRNLMDRESTFVKYSEFSKKEEVTLHIKQMDDITVCLDTINLKRKRGNNNINADSSRSHLFIRINIQQTINNSTIESHMLFVDLAGSENLRETNSEGSTKKEATKINSSLSSLKTIFSAIAKNNPHIPYRDSQIGIYLQQLGLSSYLNILIVNISPLAKDAAHTKSTLEFANVFNSTDSPEQSTLKKKDNPHRRSVSHEAAIKKAHDISVNPEEVTSECSFRENNK